MGERDGRLDIKMKGNEKLNYTGKRSGEEKIRREACMHDHVREKYLSVYLNTIHTQRL
jgi:hypothetical protein